MMTVEELVKQNELVVLWTSGDREVALKMAFMYTLSARGHKDPRLARSLPQIYRERLKLETLNEYTSEQDLIFNLKDQYGASYNAMKGLP